MKKSKRVRRGSKGVMKVWLDEEKRRGRVRLVAHLLTSDKGVMDNFKGVMEIFKGVMEGSEGVVKQIKGVMEL